MPHTGREYEIHLHRPDGTLSIVLRMLAFADHEARSQARALLRNGMASAYIWDDGDFVDCLSVAQAA